MDSITSLKELVDFCEQRVIELFNDGQQIHATFVGMDVRNNVYLSVVPDLGNRDIVKDGKMSYRQRTLSFLKLKCIEKNINRAVIFHEAWVLRTTSLDEGNMWNGKIDKHPDRIEVLVITGHTKSQKVIRGHRINRTDGKITLEKQSEAWDNLSGDFFNIVPGKTPNKEVRKMAVMALDMWNKISDIRMDEIRRG